MPDVAPTSSRTADEIKVIDDTAVRPFTVSFPDEAIDDLRRRIAATRWPDRETVDDDSQGVPLATMQELARYWAHRLRLARGARRGSTPSRNFITEIDGLDIHFIHVRSRHEDALPLIVTHGWPGSIIEQLKIIGPLTDPTAHGGDAADAFHLVIPSLPGSRLLRQADHHRLGPDAHRAGLGRADARLGYNRYVAQGGDWGAAVTQNDGHPGTGGAAGHPLEHARHRPERTSSPWLEGGDPAPAGLSAEEQRAYDAADRVLRQAPRVRADHVDPPADPVRVRRLPDRPGGVRARPRRRHRPARPGEEGRSTARTTPTSRATTCSTTSRCTG